MIWLFWVEYGTYPLKDDERLDSVRLSYLEMSEVDKLYVPLTYVNELASQLQLEFSPTCAVLGGFLAQEVLKYLSKKECPFANFFCYDSWKSTGFVMKTF